MSAPISSKKITVIAIILGLVIIGLAVIAVRYYQAAQDAVQVLQGEKTRYVRLDAEIEETRRNLDRLLKEQEEFKKMLFDERDVPAFLEGLSASAVKATVVVMDMKTENFSSVAVSKDMMTSGKSARAKVYEDFEKQQKKSSKEELKERLTLVAMPIRIKVHGTFESIVKFLNSMEGYTQLLTISNVDISTRQDYPQLTCEFKLSIYSLKKLGEIQ